MAADSAVPVETPAAPARTTYVPPGAPYGCTLGGVGCDSSFVGPLGF